LQLFFLLFFVLPLLVLIIKLRAIVVLWQSVLWCYYLFNVAWFFFSCWSGGGE